MMVLVFYWQKVTLRSSSLALQLRHTKHLPTYRLFIFRSCPFFEIQSNLAIRNFLVALKLFLSAKSSLSLWSKWQIGHRKWFLDTNLFLIAKFDCTFGLIPYVTSQHFKGRNLVTNNMGNMYFPYHESAPETKFAAKC